MTHHRPEYVNKTPPNSAYPLAVQANASLGKTFESERFVIRQKLRRALRMMSWSKSFILNMRGVPICDSVGMEPCCKSLIVSMARSIEEVSGNAERSSDVARHSVEVAHKGGAAVRRTIDGMHTLR